MQDIYVDDIGKSFPLVLVHGFFGSSDMWKLQIKHFKNDLGLLLHHYQVLEKVIM
jgi:pimeloyl-ACP methyl ester carboxylesterase